jgi:DNA replication protein DnaC
MLTHPTIEQLRALKLDGMAEAFIELQAQDTARDLAHAEWLALLLDREAASRGTRRYRTRLRAAKLRHGQAAIEDVDYRTPRRLDKVLFQQLTTCRWIAEARNLLVTGKCGVGKSWLSCALARRLAAMATPYITRVRPVCSPISSWPMATARTAVPHAHQGRSAVAR